MEDMETFENFDGHVIVTHRRLMHLKENILRKYAAAIIDEDVIYKSIVPNKTDIPIPALNKTLKKNDHKNPLVKKIKAVQKVVRDSTKPETFFELPKIEYDKAYADISAGTDISAFCEAEKFCYRKKINKNNSSDESLLDEDRQSGDCISFYNHVKFKPGVKYIVLSATICREVSEYFIKGYLKQDMEFYECKKARYVGQLIQFNCPFSRSYIDKKLAEGIDIFKELQEWSGFEYILTFMKYRKYGLYFGNLDGANELEGKNILVVGVNHQPDWIYKLFAYSIGLEFDIDESFKTTGNVVERNGYRFRFPTFDDKVLQNVQLYFLESDAEQAVGRARLLRKDCTVYFFADLILSQAVLKEYEPVKASSKVIE